MELTPKRVKEIFLDCQLTEEEITKYGLTPETPDARLEEVGKLIKGIRIATLFIPERLNQHAEEIAWMLHELPDAFRKSGGGGWSFLNMCIDKNENLWTGDHAAVEQLMMLGMGTGLVSYVMPREIWPTLPGGLPYLVLNF